MPLNQKSVPRSPGAILADCLREVNLSQSEIAAKLGVTKQYINGVIHGRESLSEERLRRIASLVGRSPDQMLAEIKLYFSWIRTTEGKDHEVGQRLPNVMAAFTMRGPRRLSEKEIREAMAVRMISITRPDSESEDNHVEIGELSRNCITCHLSDLAAFDLSRPPQNSKLIVPAGGSISIKTEENFRLGSLACLEFNGLVLGLRERGIRACCDHIHHFDIEDHLIITLDNISRTDYLLRRSMPIASAHIYFDPFANEREE